MTMMMELSLYDSVKPEILYCLNTHYPNERNPLAGAGILVLMFCMCYRLTVLLLQPCETTTKDKINPRLNAVESL